jgi:hypothetical protein
MSTEPGSDPIGDLQKWLMKAGAKSIGREVADRVKSTLRAGEAQHASVWETATTEDPADEPPECQWCPICRAARRYRDSGGSSATLSGQFAGVGDTLAGLTRDAFSLFETAMRPPQRPAASRPGPQRSSAPDSPAPKGSTGTSGAAASGAAASAAGPDSASADSAGPEGASSEGASSDGPSSDNGTVVGPGIGWPTVVHSKHEDYEAGHESGNREESGETGDGGADRGGDEQVERTAE